MNRTKVVFKIVGIILLAGGAMTVVQGVRVGRELGGIQYGLYFFYFGALALLAGVVVLMAAKI
jgi:hypothetical protein